jgi:hypothetical protein
MKNIGTILFLFLVCINATGQKTTDVINLNSSFSFYQDTIFVDIKGEMTHALKYHNKFYVLFKQSTFKYGGYEKRWLYVFANGEIEKTIDFPENLNITYLDFFVKNDSIILKPYMEKQCYYFNTQDYIWIKINKADDLIFEDEKFYIYSLDFGEWGGKTWFKDKKTGIEYVIEETTPLINKIDTTYYLTNRSIVKKIENPLMINKCDNDVTYENIKKDGKYTYWYGKPIGFDIVYEDTTFDYFDYFNFSYQPHIVTSFVYQNELLHIYETNKTTYIAKIENNTIKTIQKIANDFRFYNWTYSYRCKNLNGNNELLKFQTKDEQLFGLMEVIDNNIFIHYFINRFELTPKLQGRAKADSVFINRLNLILSDMDTLQLKDVVLAELKWGSFDITPNYDMRIGGGSWNTDKYTVETGKSYLIREDSLISNSIDYYATKSNNLVRVVLFEWEETDFKLSLGKAAKETFKKKMIFLESCITQKIGKLIENKSEKNYTEKIWKTSTGLIIEIENMKNYNRIRLVIYKD